MDDLTFWDKQILAQAAVSWVTFDVLLSSAEAMGNTVRALIEGYATAQFVEEGLQSFKAEQSQVDERMRIIRRIMDKLDVEVPSVEAQVETSSGIDFDALMKDIRGTD